MSIDQNTADTTTPLATTGVRGRSRRRRTAVGALGAAGALAAVGMASAPAQAATVDSSVLQSIQACESGGDYTAVNPTSGASGAYQFLDSTWATLAAAQGYASAADAPASVQDAAAQELYAQEGTTPWEASQSCWSDAASVAAMSTSTSSTTVSDAAVAQADVATPVETVAQVEPAAGAADEAEADTAAGADAAAEEAAGEETDAGGTAPTAAPDAAASGEQGRGTADQREQRGQDVEQREGRTGGGRQGAAPETGGDAGHQEADAAC